MAFKVPSIKVPSAPRRVVSTNIRVAAPMKPPKPSFDANRTLRGTRPKLESAYRGATPKTSQFL